MLAPPLEGGREGLTAPRLSFLTWVALEQEQAKEEMARVDRAHKTAMAAVEATLRAEKSRCQDLRARVERQAREHQLSLAEANKQMLQTQQQLDKVGFDLESAYCRGHRAYTAFTH